MTNINQLSSIDTLQLGDLLAVWAPNNGDTRKAALSTLVTFMQENLTVPGTLTTQYAAPSSTGFTVTITAADKWLILTPTAGFAAGTIVLPSAPTDKQVVSVNCTQSVAALSVTAGGTTVTGAPTSLAANGFFTLRFDAAASVWYRVG
jgi:hypothetical protein